MNVANADPGSVEAERKLRGLRALAFYVLVPLALAVTATDSGYNRVLGYSGAMVYVSLLSLVPWWVADGTTWLAKTALAPWRPALWVLTVVGALLASAVVYPYVHFVGSWFFDFWTDGAAARTATGMSRDDRVAEMIMQVGRAALFWTAANYVFDHYLGLPRFRYSSGAADDRSPSAHIVPSSSSVPPPVRFLERLERFHSAKQIWIVKAEEQYIRVIGTAGEELTLYRFNRAVIDLAAEDGFRVHRSYWVRRSAVVKPVMDGNQLSLEMKNGLHVPVSKRYHALVQQVF